jgi:hypothetical protein
VITTLTDAVMMKLKLKPCLGSSLDSAEIVAVWLRGGLAGGV